MSEELNVMVAWKNRMDILAKKESYTPEWWLECADALEFLPEAHRQGFLISFVQTMIQM